MTRSESIIELAVALSKAQAEMGGAKKDSTNPHFKSKYADLASVVDASLPALNKHGIAVVQFPRLVHAGGTDWLVEVETQLIHTSGQFVADTLALPVTKVDAQGVGSAITYARRYALGAIASVAPEDDDGNAAIGQPSSTAAPAGAMTTVTLRVKGDVMKKASGWFTIKDDNGNQYNTKSEAFALLAKDALAGSAPLVVTFKSNTYGGRDIVNLVESDAVPEPVA
jgi:hypothetical protein